MTVADWKRHDSKEQETLAKAWHEFGEVVSWAAFAVTTVCAGVALGGALWHRWGKQQHIERLKDLN